MNTPTYDGSDGRSRPESWLAHIIDQLNAEAGLLTIVHPDGQRKIDGVGHQPSCLESYRNHFGALDPLPALLNQRPNLKALAVETRRHPAYREQREFHSGFLKKYDIAHIVGFSWLNSNGDKNIIQLHRFIGTPAFLAKEARELERQIHHWRISDARPGIAPFSPSVQHERRQSDIASQLATPLAVVDGGSKVIWANPAARSASDHAWQSLLRTQKPLSNCLRPELCSLVRTCLSQHCSAETVLTVNAERHFAIATPLEGQPGLSLLQMRSLNRETPGIKTRLQRLLKLSPAESELAVLLAAGESLASIAKIRNVSSDTVRTQLQVIYRKTETHRQSELVSLVFGLGQQ